MQAQPASPDRSGLAIASIVLGVVSLCAWLFPLCGFVFSIASIVLGALSLGSSRRGLAIAGIALGAIAILLSCVNAAWGAYMGFNGQLPFLQGLQ